MSGSSEREDSNPLVKNTIISVYGIQYETPHDANERYQEILELKRQEHQNKLLEKYKIRINNTDKRLKLAKHNIPPSNLSSDQGSYKTCSKSKTLQWDRESLDSKMELPPICYTCEVADESSTLYGLSASMEKYPDKKLQDLLKEVANIDIPEDFVDKLPQCMCDDCTFKLTAAYDFVVQARLANENLLKSLHIVEIDAMVEPPLDLYEGLVVKEEPKADEYYMKKSDESDESDAEILDDDHELYTDLDDDDDESDSPEDGQLQPMSIPCQWCSLKFNDQNDLIKHVQSHGLMKKEIALAVTHIAAISKPNGVKSISCKHCSLHFKRIAHLRSHIQLRHSQQLFGNSLMNYSITNQNGFELQLDDSETEDEATAKLYVCEICQHQCRRKYQMMQHQFASHSHDKMPYECELCIFKCVSRNILYHHKRTQCLSQEKGSVCSECNYKFLWPENLQNHLRIHQKATMKRFQCSQCGKNFTSASYLNVHMRRHAGEKPYKCDLCNKAFVTKSNLTRHRRQHRCDVCNMAFAVHRDLLNHKKTHSSQQLFYCTVCGKGFKLVIYLKRHMKRHTEEKR